MASFLITSLHFATLLLLSAAEPISPPFPFGMPPPPLPEGMTPYDMPDFPGYPPPPPFGFLPPPPPPSSLSSLTPSPLLPPEPATSSNGVTNQASNVTPLPPSSSPPSKPDDPDGFNSTKYAYDNAARLAREVYRLVHPPGKEFIGVHIYFMLESPTAKAIAEYASKVTYAKDNSGDTCLANGEEASLKDFRRRQAEVVWNCEAGWKMNATLVTKAQALMNTIDGLDHQAYEKLKDCKSGQPCYEQFKLTPLAISIDKKLAEIRRNQLIDLKVLADQGHVTSLYSVYKCNADMSDNVRKDVYTSIAKINVCLSTIGLITTM